MSSNSAIRRALVLVVAIAALVTACRSDDPGDWNNAPGAPSLRPSWGARETDGKLQIWTGSPCVGITKMSLSHNFGGPDLVLTATSPAGADVEHLTLGGPYPGLTVTESWPDGLDWRSAKQLVLQVDGKGVNFGSSSQVSEIADGSADHSEDTFYFDGVGWLGPTDVAEQDGKTFTAVCTPDPEAK